MPITAVVGWAGMGARVGVHVDGTWGVDVDAEGGIEEQEDYHQSQANKSSSRSWGMNRSSYESSPGQTCPLSLRTHQIGLCKDDVDIVRSAHALH